MRLRACVQFRIVRFQRILRHYTSVDDVFRRWPVAPEYGGQIADASARYVFARLYRVGGDVGRHQNVVQLHEGMLQGLILVREYVEPLVGI